MAVQRNEFALPGKIDPLFLPPPSDFLGVSGKLPGVFSGDFPPFFGRSSVAFSGDFCATFCATFCRRFSGKCARIFGRFAGGVFVLAKI